LELQCQQQRKHQQQQHERQTTAMAIKKQIDKQRRRESVCLWVREKSNEFWQIRIAHLHIQQDDGI
jgi:hypothetical protein